MNLAGYSAGEWLLLVQNELLLFAGIFFLIGAVDELVVDLSWLWLKFTGRARTRRLDDLPDSQSLRGKAAILIPAWHEDAIIGTTIEHTLKAWPQRDLLLYIGCYRNDPATIEAVIRSANGDPRLRLVIHGRAGPSTKADCLNRLYVALEEDERRRGESFRMVLLHDAEDMVDPTALWLLDDALEHSDFVQLPVLPSAHPESRWIASHYCEEFAEAHGKAMIVRQALGAGLPSAGVGCAIGRDQLAALAAERPDKQPFAADSLTEDYILGLSIARRGGRMQFLRVRAPDGQLVATRACFPADLSAAVRQKTCWLHGIAFEGWEKLGWSRLFAESWMRARDRRGPLTAFVLALAYLLLIVSCLSMFAVAMGWAPAFSFSPVIWWLLALNLSSLVWRAAFRFAFTAREYGAGEGVRAILRIPVANIISIMAGRRAFAGYLRVLFHGAKADWDKTEHAFHSADLPPLRVKG